MSGFFAELQRRKVYRVAAAYIIAAGFIIQIGSAVFPAWELPNWTLRLVIVLLLVGFPVALILAWAYDVTPHGIQATPKVPGGHRRRNIILLVAAGAIISAAAGFFLLPRASARKIDKSVAVLPFQNLSDEKANAYFADGIQNEILTKLATVRDLKVISRTSTAKYQSKPDSLKTVAQELRVSTILEGTVQRAGDKVRVNVQLIDARTDTHLWAKSYDRDFKDVLAVESEVAAQIADALKANLSPSESHVLAAAQTENTEAYDLFLRGQYEFHQAESSLAADAYDRADTFYRQALARDPNFAEAAAELARNRLSRHWFVSPLAPAELEEVKSLIDRALALAPNSPEAHFALGLFFYWGHRQYENALAEFNRTLELQPNNADARAYCAWVYRRRGEWERSLADSQQAEELDPRDASPPLSTTWEIGAYIQSGSFSEALEELEKVKRERKSDPILIYDTGMVYAAQGKRSEALQTIKELEEMSGASLSEAHWIAKIYATLNDKEMAFSWLERGLATGAIGVFYKDDPVWDPIRSEPRFADLLQRMGIPQ
jgi:TolB-like protein/Tfp pilus assembly protein PilF